MTTFSLREPNPGAWFSFDESDPAGGKICLRIMNSITLRNIRRAAVKPRVEYKHGQRFEFTDTDEDLISDMTWDYCIVDWTGLEDDDGKPIPCTKENKVFLMRENLQFQTFVMACMGILNEQAERRVADLEKNS